MPRTYIKVQNMDSGPIKIPVNVFSKLLKDCRQNRLGNEKSHKKVYYKVNQTHTVEPNLNKTLNDTKIHDTKIHVPLKCFDPKTISINLNKKGLMTISATYSREKETDRNGMRKITTILEETVQLPRWLCDEIVSSKNNEEKGFTKVDPTESVKSSETYLSKVMTKFENGSLVISFPEKPKVEVKNNDDDQKMDDNEPVEISINFV